MIRLICTQCKSVLEMDDAFVGGVCRCQHCGTIQTVPSHLKASTGSTVSTSVGAKSLYQGAVNTGTRGNSTGLYDLADAVGSSGLSRVGNSKDRSFGGTRGAAAVKAPVPQTNHLPMLLGGAGVVIMILLGVVLWLVFGQGKPAEGPTNPGTLTSSPSVVGPQGARTTTGAVPPVVPHFLSIPIVSPRVVYLIDRSDSSKQIFDTIKAALFNSIDSLGEHTEFAVIFWGRPAQKDLNELSFPDDGLAHATPAESANCRAKFSDTQAVGATDVTAAINKAYRLNPDVIFLVTAKGISLDDSFADAVNAGRKQSKARIYVIDLANGEGRKLLEPIATKSQGSYTPFSPFDVRPD